MKKGPGPVCRGMRRGTLFAHLVSFGDGPRTDCLVLPFYGSAMDVPSQYVLLIEMAGLSNGIACRVAQPAIRPVHPTAAGHGSRKKPGAVGAGQMHCLAARRPALSRRSSQGLGAARLASRYVRPIQPLCPRLQAGRAQAAAVIGIRQAVGGQRRQGGTPAGGLQRFHHAAGKVGAATAACAHRYPFENSRGKPLVSLETACCNLSDIRPFFTEKSAGTPQAFVVKSRPSLNLEQS